MPSSSDATHRAAARKQALQHQVLAILQGRRLADTALTMGLGKNLIGLRYMDRLLAAGKHPDQVAGKPFLVAPGSCFVPTSYKEELVCSPVAAL